MSEMIFENVLRIRKRIEVLCAKLNRDAAQVRIVAVTKGRSVSRIEEAIKAGLTDIGENKVQEALLKYDQLFGYRLSVLDSSRTPNTEHRIPIEFHMVGHLQTNKVKDAVRIFDLIHSVDSVRLAVQINKEAKKANKIQDILLEVNISKDPDKFGLKPEIVEDAIKEMSVFENLQVKGLMTIAPAVDNLGESRVYFRMLRELRDKIEVLSITRYPLPILSMGMSDDFTVAIEEGSNMIRLGRAIFNPEFAIGFR